MAVLKIQEYCGDYSYRYRHIDGWMGGRRKGKEGEREGGRKKEGRV